MRRILETIGSILFLACIPGLIWYVVWGLQNDAKNRYAACEQRTSKILKKTDWKFFDPKCFVVIDGKMEEVK